MGFSTMRFFRHDVLPCPRPAFPTKNSVLPGSTRYYQKGNLRAISGISNDLMHTYPNLSPY
eukprot:1339515-Amorphochlora_amoeboformis.AAC.1